MLIQVGEVGPFHQEEDEPIRIPRGILIAALVRANGIIKAPKVFSQQIDDCTFVTRAGIDAHHRRDKVRLDRLIFVPEILVFIEFFKYHRAGYFK
jgi:hypothetical protein